jgi:hypothetical protein
MSLQDALNLRSLDVSLNIIELEAEIYGTSTALLAVSLAEIGRFGDAVFSTANSKAKERVEPLAKRVVEHLALLGSYVASGGSPQDPRNHWTGEIKAWLDTIRHQADTYMKGKAKEEWLKFVEEVQR